MVSNLPVEQAAMLPVVVPEGQAWQLYEALAHRLAWAATWAALESSEALVRAQELEPLTEVSLVQMAEVEWLLAWRLQVEAASRTSLVRLRLVSRTPLVAFLGVYRR